MVMEHIEGETLADRLKKGALPLDQALRYGVEIADALDKAHKQGVVHRDLKPGNIMLTKSGAKLLDFGLAKTATEQARPGDLSALPTQAKPLTQEGSILGTFQYMAPEQLEGKEADSRTDIFAFGSVLYEMVTGKRAFEGKSQASLIGAIMTSDPPAMSTLQTMTPPLLDHVVRTCLAKDPDQRWQAAADVARELSWIRSGDSQLGPFRVGHKRWPWVVSAGVALVFSVVLGLRTTTPPVSQPTQLSVVLPENLRLTGQPQTFAPPIAISPGGRTLAITAQEGGHSQLFLRDLASFDIVPVPETEGATSPFFSPDWAWLGFHADGKLQKVPIAGGAPITICEAPNFGGTGIDWGVDDSIVFTWSPVGSGLFRVSAAGGQAERLTTPDVSQGVYQHAWPQFLPDGKTVLFSLWGGGGGAAILSLETGDWQRVLPSARGAIFVATGHLLYGVELGRLEAVPFDLDRLEISGPPRGVLDGVDSVPRSARFTYAVSLRGTGTLVYLPENPRQGSLVWVDRQGSASPITEEPGQYEFPRLSPNGSRVTFQWNDGGGSVGAAPPVWIYDLERGTRTKHTVENSNNVPIWTPDGKRVTFASNRAGAWNIYSKAVDASGDAERLVESEDSQFPMSWSPDGELLAFGQRSPDNGWDIGTLSREGETSLFLATRFDEQAPRFAPNGRFLAYVSNESGRDDVYVQPFPATGRKWTISTGGGTEPLWARNGRELFYRNGDAVMAVDVETFEELINPGTPRLLFEGGYESGIYPNYDISPDGERFLMVRSETPPTREIRVLQNWFEELKVLVPTD